MNDEIEYMASQFTDEGRTAVAMSFAETVEVVEAALDVCNWAQDQYPDEAPCLQLIRLAVALENLRVKVHAINDEYKGEL
jgi:hypothetical protein